MRAIDQASIRNPLMLGRFLQYLALGVLVKAILEPTSCGMAIRFAAVDSMFCSTVEVLVAPRMTCPRSHTTLQTDSSSCLRPASGYVLPQPAGVLRNHAPHTFARTLPDYIQMPYQ